jgi:hypothetical protein
MVMEQPAQNFTAPIAAAALPHEAAVVEASFTIKDAVEIYTRRSKEETTVLRQAVNSMIENKIRTDFNNDSYIDALVLTEIMFDRSNKSLRIFTGDAEGGFFRVLVKHLRTAIERIEQNNGIVRFIVLSKTIPGCLTELISYFPKSFQVLRAAASRDVRHFIVSDGKMARLEEPHIALTENSPANSIKAKVFYNEPAISGYLETQFDSMWNVAKDFPINKT